jgi:transcriptional regulator with XRE-family HTH domain
MTTYKELVRSHLQPLIEAGLTQREVAEKLGIESPNYISMVLSDRYPEAQLPMTRLPAMCALCGLTATESLRLAKRLVAACARKTVQLDVATFEWMLRCTALALKEPRGAV